MSSINAMRKGLLQRIHVPPSIGPRESQQLLESITTSFRKNLDREHPWETDETRTHVSNAANAVRAAETSPDSRLDPAGPPSTHNHRPTDRHLQAVLSNPLFAYPENVIFDTARSTTRAKPFLVFDSAVSRGLMTTRRAAGFLATIRSHLSAESPDNLTERMGALGAGLRVLQWLRASGQENDLAFLQDGALVGAIIPFLYAEGLEEVAWNWLAQLAARITKRELKSSGVDTHVFSKLMPAMISANIESGSQSPVSLDASFAALVKAQDLLPCETLEITAAFRATWARLSWASTVDVLERPKPSVTLFEKFVDIGRPFRRRLDLAHLDLHHPTTPTHSSAIEYLRPRQGILDQMPTMAVRQQQQILCLILDAAERLRRTGQLAEAPWVADLKRTICDNLHLGILNLGGRDPLHSGIPGQRGF
ncbi:hypothetical protein F5Y14DRAFT_336973 [Nemania sp. NC0429]|nr:hypothetical protein F5Y14DRAFT_336973 [Nemania sp. NC0429]